jgi:hypothetical protein
MTYLELAEAVTAELSRRGVSATLEYPGYISLAISPAVHLECGTANGTWDCDVTDYGDDWSVAETIPSDIPASCQDVQQIANHLACTFTAAVEVHQASNARSRRVPLMLRLSRLVFGSHAVLYRERLKWKPAAKPTEPESGGIWRKL